MANTDQTAAAIHPTDVTVDIGFELGRAAAVLAADDRRAILPRPGAQLISLFEDLGADAELIWILASFGHTLSDRAVLAALSQWNERRRLQSIISERPEAVL